MTSETRRERGASLVGAMLERRYRVDALIARGGMSTVYRGLDTRLDRPVAIKVMDAQYSGDRSFVERFEREARAAAKLHHPDIVAVYDQGVDHGTGEEHVFLVMQLVEGCTLRDLIMDERGPLPLATALSVIEPVLSALQAAHQAEMVHRDVKPENVLISTDGSVKVADFGLVRAAAEAGTTSGSVILGTVAYLSPEQVTTGAADARTDVYAAGIVLYEMLTGRPPYVGDTALSVAYRHVNDDVPPPAEQVPDLPPAINDLVVRATRRDPAQRPQSAEAFLAELQQARRELGISLVPVPVPESAEHTTLMPAVAADPPTAQIPAVQAAPPPQQPNPTRAMLRPTTDDDFTQEMAPVPAGPVRERRNGRRTVAIWTAIVLVLAALVGGAAFWLGLGSYVDVPKLVGQQEAAAQKALSDLELTGNVTRENDNNVPEGVVISSNPREGSQVRSGSTVDLVVSLGKPKVPEIAEGTPLAEAESIIRNAKLQPKHDESADQFHTSVPEGRVISVDPAPGTPLNISGEVSLIVSKGPPPVPVPDVRGMSRDDAFATLANAGFEPYELGREFNSDVAADHVIGTDPEIGTEVKLVGKPRIGVKLSNAVTVPSLNGVSVEEAQQQVAALGLRLNVNAIFHRENMVIFGQYPLPGSKVEPGSEIHVTAL
ncbi:Stk1 family PASTA domain-containing Ser/Thr kinase [Saccharopolyspora sp. WRP15-2]|uniref:non-specific serine/threonine protein kinase n=1 Tax=Saccharopolyspora oryzae TaxID=2997343 RepID=A0ABT4V9E4_9PSEU|nr:Stk1 family PASTA domain-containing Ser/Thr kinase [Saccharopolyspora oryzae]MDA3629912.1 Stk1 family PASTA domain-containing Ser/Thr kinase [Saccharopolyspora oryzae]